MQVIQIKGESEGVYSFTSTDRTVYGVITLSEEGVSILEWQSDTKGRTVTALKELKQAYKNISVVNIGIDDTEPSWRYWMHIYSKGLVNRLSDDDNLDVTPTS